MKLIEKMIPQEIKDINNNWEKAIILCRWIRNLTKPSMEISDMNLWDSPSKMLMLMKEGKGASCGVYTTVYVAAAQSIGIPARYVQLIRQGNIYDTHVVAEVWNDKSDKWAVMDSTFNTYYEINEIPASAADIKLAFEIANCKNKTEWYNYIKPSDKSKLEEYYLFQYLLYDIVLLAYSPTKRTWEKIPPMRAFINDWLYFSQGDDGFAFRWNFINSLFDLIFPCTFCFALISLIYLNLRRG